MAASIASDVMGEGSTPVSSPNSLITLKRPFSNLLTTQLIKDAYAVVTGRRRLHKAAARWHL
jgi:hypothetical protein